MNAASTTSLSAPVRRRAMLAGLLTAAVALGVAELVAGLVRPGASPFLAVGDGVIDAAPPWLKDFAVTAFGTADKAVLLVGMGVVIAGLAALLGVLAVRRRWVGVAALAAFGALGAVAAVVRPESGPVAAVPSLVGGAVGIGALVLLLRPLTVPQSADSGEPATADGPPPSLDRRRFTLLAAGSAVLAAGGVAAGRWFGAGAGEGTAPADVALPTPDSPAEAFTGELEADGLSPFFTPNPDFYRIDTALRVPRLNADDWRLRIHGTGIEERRLSYAELLDRGDLIERDITLACVSNPVGGTLVGNARWLGVPLRAVLDESGVAPPSEGGGADQLVSRSSDGMTIGTPVEAVMDGRDAMLAIAMNGEPLPLDHGFPVRMVVPGLYGYVSACKWLVELEVTTFDAFDAYWVPRGWADRAPIKTQSRIDTPTPSAQLSPGRVPIAGVAWAQHTGIERVEVRVDDGPWQQAELSQEHSIDTWRQWVLDWRAERGEHRIQVRAVDSDGETQTAQRRNVRPDGATGLHSVRVTVG